MVVNHPNNKNLVVMIDGIDDMTIIEVEPHWKEPDVLLIENIKIFDGSNKYYIDDDLWDSFVELINETDRAIKESGIEMATQYYEKYEKEQEPEPE